MFQELLASWKAHFYRVQNLEAAVHMIHGNILIVESKILESFVRQLINKGHKH